MAKQDKVLAARRKQDRQDDSVLIRSAESLGRVIGTLQRQLDGAAKRLKPGTVDADAISNAGSDGDGGGSFSSSSAPPRSQSPAGKDAVAAERPARTTGIKRMPARKAAAAPRRTTKKAAAKPAAPRRAAAKATKTATRARAGARKAAGAATSARSTKSKATAKTKRQR